MADSFSERLAKKIELAKTAARTGQNAGNALISTSSKSLDLVGTLDAALSSTERSLIAQDIEGRIQRRNTNQLGVFAFFNRKGEEARTKLARAQAEHASKLLELEHVEQAARTSAFNGKTLEQDLVRKKILEVASAQLQLTTIQQQIDFIGIQAGLVQQAAERGFDFKTDQEIRTKELELTRELLAIEEKERIAFHYKQLEIDKEIEGTIRLHNTAELSRAQQIQMLIDYGKKVGTTTSEFERSVYALEVERLQKELYGEPSRMAGQADAGYDPEGGAPPNDAGGKPQSTPRPPKQSNTAKDSGHLN